MGVGEGEGMGVGDGGGEGEGEQRTHSGGFVFIILTYKCNEPSNGTQTKMLELGSTIYNYMLSH